MRLFLILLASLGITKGDPLPSPELTTFYDYNEQVFGMWWMSSGAEYDYILEVNELDDFGWFTIATWTGPAKNSVMSGYTFISFGNEAIARVRVRRNQPGPVPRDNSKWKVLTPVRF